ncbi:MAG TPA: hypothetical protein VD905_01915 [Flavobacteriales bacterium]|nr:hypothetical protein [Flavobacteriales bacterium]
MKRTLTLTALTISSAFTLKAENHVLLIEGQYQNKNIYVSNSVASSGIGFCAYEVRVNGEITSDQISSSAFEIDLTTRKLTQGQNVTIQIFHKEGCVPKVLNANVLKPMPTFETKSITLDEAGALKWITTNESGVLTFDIEQYKWNKWVKVGEVQGIGSASENKYEFKVILVSGENKFRVIQKGNLGKVQKSPTAEISSTIQKPDYKWNKSSKSVEFTNETSYEVYDVYGQIRKKGYGKTIDMANLARGEYYLSYDNTTETIKI